MKVAIYRTVYRLHSEAFIKEQVCSLKKYVPFVLAREITPLAVVEQKKVFCATVVSNSFFRKFFFTLFGWANNVKNWTDCKLIHAHFGQDAAMILPFARRKGIPLIVTFHGGDAQCSKMSQFLSFRVSNIIYLLREKYLYEQAASVIAVSNFIKEKLVSRGCAAEKIKIHYIGVDTDYFSRPLAIKNKFTLVHVGRHVEVKGIDTLLHAISLVKEKIPEIKLVQVGGGALTDHYKKLASDLGVEDNVEWVGSVNHEEVIERLAGGCVYVHPSRKDQFGQTEAFGIALLEAQSLGLPVIATRTGGIPEALKEFETGYLVDESDYIALSERIMELLSDEDLRMKMSAAARSFVVENFDIKIQSDKLESIYDQVVSGNV